MCYAWKSSPPPEKPSPMGWLQDLLWEVRTALATLTTLVIVVSIAASLNLPAVTGECPEGGTQPRVVAMLDERRIGRAHENT